jgi:hypothetical protein
VFPDPALFEQSALYPIPVLQLPVVTAKSALYPIPVLPVPVELADKDKHPSAVLVTQDPPPLDAQTPAAETKLANDAILWD